MRLVNCDELLAPLNLIRKLLNKTSLNIFLSTENSAVIKYFLNCEIDRITYFNFPLLNGSLILNTEMANVILPQMFANVKHSLFANFVIGTIGSNWNRLLIELRVARAGFANNYYFEVGDHICLSFQHCKYLNREFEMNWWCVVLVRISVCFFKKKYLKYFFQKFFSRIDTSNLFIYRFCFQYFV